jgi:hypothetical protein
MSGPMAGRRARYAARGPFLSPAEAPPKCEPNGGDKSLRGYRCVNPDCRGRRVAAAANQRAGLGPEADTGVAWGAYVEPRAWGIGRDPQPEDGWCPFCGEDGEPT